jgi:hypothetical protein
VSDVISTHNYLRGTQYEVVETYLYTNLNPLVIGSNATRPTKVKKPLIWVSGFVVVE